MQSLPTALTTAQLETLLSTFPPAATIFRGAGIITVKATHKTTGLMVKLLSAASSNGKHWHVMAKPGLIQAV